MSKILTLICPVMNEEEMIDIFLSTLSPYVEEALALIGSDAKREIIFVDDGSRDSTPFAISRHAQADKSIRLIRFSRNFGKEAALTAGIKHAKGDAVIPIDVDLQEPPEVIVRMVRAWLAGAEIVNAKRINRSSDSWIKRRSAGLFYDVYNALAKRPIPKNVGDYRLLDRKVIEAVNSITESNRFMKAIFSWVGFREETVEFVREQRAAGTSKFRYWKLWNFALDGITAASTTPLRIWTYVGLLLAIMTFLYAIFLVTRTVLFGNAVPGYASLMVTILISSSFNFISLGILGEYIGRISEEVRERPLYIISETLNLDV